MRVQKLSPIATVPYGASYMVEIMVDRLKRIMPNNEEIASVQWQIGYWTAIPLRTAIVLTNLQRWEYKSSLLLPRYLCFIYGGRYDRLVKENPTQQ